MKTIKNVLLISLLLGCFTIKDSYSQELKEVKQVKSFTDHDDDDDDDRTLPPVQYKVPNSTQIKKVVIKDLLAEIKIAGSSGSEIIIDVKGLEGTPKKAKGLKPLYGNGCLDNTGAGVAANESGGVLTICGASKGSEDAHYMLTLPKGVNVSLDYSSPFAHNNIEIKDMESEVEISSLTADIKCLNVTGPLVLNSTSGNIDVVFTKLNQNSPTSISLISGDLDVTLPENSVANLEMNSITGGIYTDFDFKASNSGNLRKIGGNNIETRINGGGVGLNLNCTSGNIYLRKK